MKSGSQATLLFGIIFLSLTIFNGFSASKIDPAFQRAEILAGLCSIGLLLVSIIWSEYVPIKAKKVDLKGDQGFFIKDTINEPCKSELAWGSQILLTATAASTILIYWNKSTILKRGLISSNEFVPGEISNNVLRSKKLINLSKLVVYPESYEFDKILNDIPSIIISPIGSKGLVIVGGWSERCFNRKDEVLISGWSDKLDSML